MLRCFLVYKNFKKKKIFVPVIFLFPVAPNSESYNTCYINTYGINDTEIYMLTIKRHFTSLSREGLNSKPENTDL